MSARATPGLAQASASDYRLLLLDKPAGSEHKPQRQSSDNDFTHCPNKKRAQPLFTHIGNVGAKPDPRKRQQESPAGKIGQAHELRTVENLTVASAEIRMKPNTNLGNFFQRNAALLPTPGVCCLRAQWMA